MQTIFLIHMMFATNLFCLFRPCKKIFSIFFIPPPPPLQKNNGPSLMWKEEILPWLFVVWVLYVWVALVPLIGAIFGRIEDEIDKETFFGPNVLKMTLCISPLLLLLLLNTAVDSADYRDLVFTLSLQIALDLFDGVEMLEVILEENEFSHGIPKGFEKAIIAFVCISILVSPLQLMENKLTRDSGTGEWERFSRGRQLCVSPFR